MSPSPYLPSSPLPTPLPLSPSPPPLPPFPAHTIESVPNRTLPLPCPRFLKYCNEELLKDALAADPTRKEISADTAKSWLHTLGFSYERHRKGMYFDGHERADVIIHRSELLVMLAVLKEVTVEICGEDCEEVIWPDLHPGEAPLVLVVQVRTNPTSHTSSSHLDFTARFHTSFSHHT